MEVILGLFGLSVVGFIVIGPVVLLIKTSQLKRSLEELRGDVDDLRMSLLRVRSSVASSKAALVVPATHDQPLKPAAPAPVPPAPTSDEAALQSNVSSVPSPPVETEPKVETQPTVETERPDQTRPTEVRPVEWEKWFGIRGAAILGGIVLSLAGVMFFRYAIDRGWLSPGVRVAAGTLAGIACLVWSQKWKGRYGITAHALCGGGLVILYTSFWAARALYDLIPLWTALLLMSLTTTVASLLAVRQRALLIAMLGLGGGLLTPMLLSTGSNRPIGLFGYLLVVDAGFLFVAIKRRWSSLALVALVGTCLLELSWLATRMRPEQAMLALGILGVFAFLFVGVSRHALSHESEPKPEHALWLVTRGIAVGTPYVFMLYLGVDAKLSVSLMVLAGYLAILGTAASWMSRKLPAEQGWISVATAGLQLAVIWVFVFGARATEGTAVEIAGAFTLLALVFYVFCERPASPTHASIARSAAFVTLVGLFAISTLVFVREARVLSPWPCIALWLVLAALAVRLSLLASQPGLQMVIALVFAVAFFIYRFQAFETRAASWSAGPQSLVFGIDIGLAIFFHVVGRFMRAPENQRWADRAASIFALVLVVAALEVPERAALRPFEIAIAPLALAAVGILSATRLGDGRFVLPIVVAVGLVESLRAATTDAPEEIALSTLAIASASAMVWPLWLIATQRRFSSSRALVYAAALSLPVHFLPMWTSFREMFGAGAIGLLPVSCGAMALMLLALARASWAEPIMRYRATVWFSAVVLAYLSVAIPMQLEKQWITIGWALMAVALLVLWQRLDHEGLKWLALVLLGCVVVRLVANPSVLEYEARGAMRIVNWIMYTYLVPASCLLFASHILAPREVDRLRPWEESFYGGKKALGAALMGFGCIVVLFVWINLAILDWYAQGPLLRVSFERRPARDLTFSIAWIGYAIVLLSIGLVRARRALRITSLVVMAIAAGKVFLYDLGKLEGLYQVLSLAGLAISLLAISFLYQRVVYRKTEAAS